jgi:adenine-specific DNA methylase
MEVNFGEGIGRIVGVNKLLFSFNLMILMVEFSIVGVVHVLLPVTGLGHCGKTPQEKNKREKLLTVLQSAGIETRPIVAGNFTRNPVIHHLEHAEIGDLPNSDLVHDQGFFVGNHHFDIKEKLEKYLSYLSNPKYLETISKVLGSVKIIKPKNNIVLALPSKKQINVIKDLQFFDRAKKLNIEIMDFDLIVNIVI